MTAEIVSICRFEGCRRAAAYPGQSRCTDHRLRFVKDEPVEAQQPAWVRRMAHNAKDFTGSAA